MPMNKRILKVCGHRRAGNNFLCGSLYINFYHDQDLSGPKDVTKSKFTNHKGDIVHHNEWGRLFGVHSFGKPRRLDVKHCIYIMRNSDDIILSYWKRKHMLPVGMKNISFEDFYYRKLGYEYFRHYPERLKGSRMIEYIKAHVRNWRKIGVYIVTYEDLYHKPIKTLGEIAKHFGLKYEGKLKPLTQPVGWKPAKARPGEGIKAVQNIKKDKLHIINTQSKGVDIMVRGRQGRKGGSGIVPGFYCTKHKRKHKGGSKIASKCWQYRKE